MSTPITSELIARTGAALAEGGWRYTPRQLYYATCAAAESPSHSPARGELAMGVLLGLVALILLPFRPVAIGVGILAALSLLLGLLTGLTHRPRVGRVLAISFAEFETLLRGEPPPPGMLDGGEPAERAVNASSGGASGTSSAAVIVCDTTDSVAAVRANLAKAGIDGVPVLSRDIAVDGLTAIALHDASPAGCALPLQLLDAGAHAVDAGLRPAWVDRADMQVLEGAPARMPRDLSPLLSDPELDWLRSGRRVELAVLPPEGLMHVVRAALERASAASGSVPLVASEDALP